MDKIKITNLEVFCHHGVYKEENVLGQKFLVSAVLYTDVRKAAKEDNIHDSVSYADVCHYIKELMENYTYRLIESVAENLAKMILIKFKLIKKIEIELKKPWAPILLPIETVSVEIARGWHKVYLSIGSNLGDKEDNLKKAIELLEKEEDLVVTKVSSFLNTKPVGPVEQDDFLNAALECETLRTPEELLSLIGEIESGLKRERIIHWGPRTIDLDIVFFDDFVIDTETLTIPHKEMQNREFVLQPLCEVAPAFRHPLLGKSVRELLVELRNSAE